MNLTDDVVTAVGDYGDWIIDAGRRDDADDAAPRDDGVMVVFCRSSCQTAAGDQCESEGKSLHHVLSFRNGVQCLHHGVRSHSVGIQPELHVTERSRPRTVFVTAATRPDYHERLRFDAADAGFFAERQMKHFHGFKLDTTNHCLWRGDERVALTPKAFDLLRYLVEHADRLVSHDQILQTLWTA